MLGARSSAAFRKTLRRYLLCAEDSLAHVALKVRLSTVAPRLYFVFRGIGGAVDALTTHFGDVLGCGEPDLWIAASGAWRSKCGVAPHANDFPIQ